MKRFDVIRLAAAYKTTRSSRSNRASVIDDVFDRKKHIPTDEYRAICDNYNTTSIIIIFGGYAKR